MFKHQHDGVQPELPERSREHEAEAERRAFMASLSHNVRTSLQNIYGSAQLMDAGVRGALTRAQRHDAQRSQANERHLLKLVDSVISFARWEDVDSVALEDISVRAAMALTDAEVQDAAAEKGVNYEPRHNAVAADIVVRAESIRLREIILQMMMTAVKFWRPYDSMYVHALTVGDRVWIRVSDTAAGIAERDLAQSLQQLGPKQLVPPQVGAESGFLLTQRLARAMGGQLTVVSKPGRAPTFTLALQRGRGPEPAETAIPIPIASVSLFPSHHTGASSAAEDE